jgi:hypothetical protein
VVSRIGAARLAKAARRRKARRSTAVGAALVALVFAACSAGAAGAGVRATTARADAAAPEFTVAPSRGLVGTFGGYGGQLNQHVYADISGPPPDLPALEAKVLALQPQLVRIFFNSTEWAFPDRMDSFVRTVELAQRAQSQIDVTWQGGTFAGTLASMPRFADVLADLVQKRGVTSLWVTLFNEPNSDRLTLAQYEQCYRTLDRALRELGVRDRVRFMGGDLVGTTSPLGQSQYDWFRYMASRMGDLLDAWSVHVYWNFWDVAKIDRRLWTEVRMAYVGLPAEQRRPIYVTEFGVRGVPTFEGERNFEPGLWPDGTPMAVTTASAFQEAWLMLRAPQLGFSGAAKWDLYSAKYDNGTQDYSAIGPGVAGWPLRPSYTLLQLLTLTTKPGWSVVDVVRDAAADPAKVVTAYVSPAGNVTVLGLDRAGAVLGADTSARVPYGIGGLPPHTLFRLLLWNGDGTGTNQEIGFLDSGADGVLRFDAPLGAVFAVTSAPLELPPGGLG